MISTESKPGNPYIRYEGYIGFAAKVAETKLQLSSITVSHNFLNIFHMAFKYQGHRLSGCPDSRSPPITCQHMPSTHSSTLVNIKKLNTKCPIFFHNISISSTIIIIQFFPKLNNSTHSIFHCKCVESHMRYSRMSVFSSRHNFSK